MDRYDLAFEWIPSLIEIQKGEKECHQFFTKENLIDCVQDSFEGYSIDDIDFWTEKIQPNTLLIKINFPKPLKPVEPKFGLIIIDTQTDEIEYFLLEMTFNDDENLVEESFIVGSVPQLYFHVNHGLLTEAPTMDNFYNRVIWLKNRFKSKRL